jgi:hypothetical protein
MATLTECISWTDVLTLPGLADISYVTQSYVLDLQTENSEPQKRGWFWQKKKGDEEEKD